MSGLTIAQALDVADRSQSLWERSWQSGTAAILLVVWLLTLFLFLRSQHLRVRDLTALTREVGAIVGENAKALALLTKAIEEKRPKRRAEPAAPKP